MGKKCFPQIRKNKISLKGRSFLGKKKKKINTVPKTDMYRGDKENVRLNSAVTVHVRYWPV